MKTKTSLPFCGESLQRVSEAVSLSPQRLAYLWLGTSELWCEVMVKDEGRASETESLSEATHCCLPRAMSQQGLVQWSWKMSQRARLLKGPCSLVPRMSCVRRAVWTIEAETGGLGLWEKGGRGQDEGGRRYPPLQMHTTGCLVGWSSKASASTGDFLGWENKTKQWQRNRNQPTSHTQRRKAFVGQDPRRKSSTLHKEKSVWPPPSHSPKLAVEPKVHHSRGVGTGHTHCRPTGLGTEVLLALSTGGQSIHQGPFSLQLSLPQLLRL